MYKLIALCFFVAAASACQYAPGTTVTTSTTTTTTVSGSGSSAGGSSVGLSGSDRELIRSSWERATRNGEVAPAILLKFIQEHPEYQKKFSAFADVPQGDLLKNGNFLAQAFTIMAGLNVVIHSLGSDELLAVEMAHLGRTHFERGVTRGMFEQFARVVVDTLDDKIALSDAEERAWENGLAGLVQGVSKNLKRKEDIAHPLTQLTPDQVSDVKRSWANVRGDRNAIVSKIMLSLFAKNPRLQSKFDAFDDVPASGLSSNAAFNAQVAKIADRIDAMIGVLDTPLQMGGQIRYMAFSHKPRGVGRQEFQDFNDLLVDALSAKGVTSDDLESWKGVLSTMAKKIAKIQGI